LRLSGEQSDFSFGGVGEEGSDASDFCAVLKFVGSDAQHIHAHLAGDDFNANLLRHLR